MDFEKICWAKGSGHGPSSEHTIAEEQSGVITTFCGRSYDRAGLEELDLEKASGECRLCVRGMRKRLLADEGVGLDLLVAHGAMTERAAEILEEEGFAEISHVEIRGSGKWGRIVTEDARAAVAAKEGA